MSDIRSLFGTAVGAFSERVDGVAADAWSQPTPCADWDVRGLVNHVVGEILWAPPLLQGKTIADVGDQFDGDVLGEDPAAAWHAATKPALDATNSTPLERTVQLSFGDFPAQEYSCRRSVALAATSVAEPGRTCTTDAEIRGLPMIPVANRP